MEQDKPLFQNRGSTDDENGWGYRPEIPARAP